MVRRICPNSEINNGGIAVVADQSRPPQYQRQLSSSSSGDSAYGSEVSVDEQHQVKNALEAAGVGAAVTKPSIYNIPRRFGNNSKLHKLMSDKCPDRVQMSKFDYTLLHVLLTLRQLIATMKLYDPNNTTMIVCNEELESALEVKALHITEIREIVCKQLQAVDPVQLARIQQEDERIEQERQRQRLETLNRPSAPSVAGTLQQARGDNSGSRVGINNATAGQQQSVQQQRGTGDGSVPLGGLQTQATVFDADKKFWVKPNFLKVLRMVQAVDKRQLVFTYREIAGYLSQYIMENKKKFFDQRNIKVALVQGDPLGAAFNVKAFHRSQVTNLIRNQLIPYQESSKAMETQHQPPNPSSSSTGVTTKNNADVEEQRRKRNTSDSDLNGREKRRRSSISITVVSTDEETIYSAQGYETTAMADTLSSSDEDDDEEDKYDEVHVYSVEYEPDDASSEDEKNSGGKKSQDSSDDDSVIDDVVIALVAAQDSDLSNRADDSDSDFMDSQDENDIKDYDIEQGSKVWKCLNCEQTNVPVVGYCYSCYKERKDFMPERPKPKHRKRKDKKNAGGIALKKSHSMPPPKRSSPLKRSVSDPYGNKLNENDDGVEECSSSQESSATGSGSQDSGFSQPESQELAKSSDTDEDNSPDTEEAEVEVKVSGSKKAVGGSDSRAICDICCVRPKDACLIHGRIAHQVCCYTCAKKMYKKNRKCPYCRIKIEKIVELKIA